MAGFVTGARLAVGTLTIVPVGALPTIDRNAARWAMVLAPVAALPVAALAGAVAWAGARAGLPALLTGALVCAALAWGTRAMHWDGLADTADGLAAGWDRARALEIMRRGDAGPVAVGVLALTLLIDAVALAALVPAPRGWLLIAAVVMVSRLGCTIASTRGIPAARPDGLGVVMAGAVPVMVTGVLVVLGVAGLAGVGHVAFGAPVAGAAAALFGLAASGLLIVRCRRVFGGVTGDVMGAAVEVALAVSLVAFLAVLPR